MLVFNASRALEPTYIETLKRVGSSNVDVAQHPRANTVRPANMGPAQIQLHGLPRPPLELEPADASDSQPGGRDLRMTVGFIAPASSDSPYRLAPIWNLPRTDRPDSAGPHAPDTSINRFASPSPSALSTSPTSSFSSVSSSFTPQTHDCVEPSDAYRHVSTYASDPRLHATPYPIHHHRSLSAEATLLLLRSRTPRAARPSYTERQKYFIMYTRVVLDQPWPEIQRGFFQQYGKRRSKSGLCSVYYRTRKAWGMEEVLVNMNEGEDTLEGDRRAVLSRGKGIVGEGF